MISRVCYCFSLSRVSYNLHCNKLSVHNRGHICSIPKIGSYPHTGTYCNGAACVDDLKVFFNVYTCQHLYYNIRAFTSCSFLCNIII